MSNKLPEFHYFYTRSVPFTEKQKSSLIIKEQIIKPTNEKLTAPIEIKLQSGETKSTSGGDVTTAQTVVFSDEMKGTVVESVPVSQLNSYGDETASVPLADFLKRPVLLTTVNWELTDAAQANFNTIAPWQAFFNNTIIKKKLDNYAFIRCNLKLKFVINASPFYYGSLQFAYQPLPNYKTSTINTSVGTPLIPMSQRPHVFVYPQNNQGGEMLLPFLFHKNWLDLNSSTEMNWFGDLTTNIYTQLRSANGTTGTSLDVQIFAWAEDVELMGPTIELAMQSGEIDSAVKSSKDEYNGMISKPASAIATATGLLGTTPVIGPFMTATSIAATAIGNIASLFGYTNVPNISDQHGFKNQPFAQFASPEISKPTERLCLDPKNELSIDNKIHGASSEDQLACKDFFARESYLTSLSYIETQSEGDALLAINVSPSYHGIDTLSTTTSYDLTPLYYGASLFKYWRGDVIFRFKIIATQYHKGRIRINYTPTGNISAAGTGDQMTSTFTRIVDIGSEDNVEIVVPYMQATPWLRTFDLETATLASLKYRTDGISMLPVRNFDNGQLTVKVMTNLTSPAATSTVKIQVFVRGGDNFEVAMPRNIPDTTTHLALQSAENIDEVASDVAGSSCNNKHPARYLVNMGENITSFRQLMRRTQKVGSYALIDNETAPYVINKIYFSKYPRYFGYDANGPNNATDTATTGTARFNYVHNSVINHLANCFIGQRGSMNWEFNLDSPEDLTNSFSVERSSNVLPTGSSLITGTAYTYANPSSYAVAGMHDGSGIEGMSLTNTHTQSGLSVNIPNYNMYKFNYTVPTANTNGLSYDGSDVDGAFVRITTRPNFTALTVQKSTILDSYCSIGPDYSLIYFLNIPTIYKLAVPPPAAEA